MKMPLYWKLFEYFADSTCFLALMPILAKAERIEINVFNWFLQKTIENLILKFSVIDFIVLERTEFHPLFVFEFMK